MVLDEDKAGGVLEQLGLGVDLDALLEDQVADPGHLVGGVADRRRDRRGPLGVAAGEIAAPAPVALAAGRVRVARDGEAAEVLGADRQPEHLAGVRGQPLEPGGHPTTIDQVDRLVVARRRGAARVPAVLLVDRGIGRAQPVAHPPIIARWRLACGCPIEPGGRGL